MGKYFTVEKLLTISASDQHSGAATADQLLVDWTAIEIPKGASCLRSATVLIRAKGDATPTENVNAFHLAFSKTNTVSLGSFRAGLDHRPSNDFIGVLNFDAENFSSASLESTAIATLGTDSAAAAPPLVLQGDPTTGNNVGFDTIYVAMIAGGSFDFRSINAIAEAGTAGAASTQVITMDGTSMDVREHFAAGDVVHIGTSVGTPAADSLIGTVASADSATQITLTSTSATDLVDGDILYNINPIKIVLGFEK
jgi:hypothetical protein